MLMQRFLLTFILLSVQFSTFSQQVDSTKTAIQFSGAVSATNNGISLVPIFSLEKPATTFDFAIRGKKLSFEPQLNFSIETAKPWIFIFWVRYKLIESDKFKLNIGTHPAFVFNNISIEQDGTSKDLLTTNRNWVGELSPNYMLSKNTSIGLYYLYARGLNSGIPKNGHFVGLNSVMSSINISKQFSLRFIPQVYYLKLDTNDGFYFTSSLTLRKKNFPISISSLATKKIQSDIASKDFVWNIGLSYSY